MVSTRHRRVALRRIPSSIVALVPALPALALGQELPDGWRLEDIGTPPVTQASESGDGCLGITAQGGGIGEVEDRIAFLHRPVRGDCGIEARFESLGAGLGAGEVSVQLRGSLSTHGPLAASVLYHTVLWVPQLNFRGWDGAPFEILTSLDQDPSVLPLPPNAFLRLERRGDTFTAFSSHDGKLWVEIAERTAPGPTPDELLAGISFAGTRGELAARVCDLRIDDPSQRLPRPRWTAPDFGFVGEPVTFDATASLAGRDAIVSYHWRFDELFPAEGRIVSHIFDRDDTILVTLTVTDASGRSVRWSDAIPILRSPRPLGEWRAVELGTASRAEISLDGECLRMVAPGIHFTPTLDTSEFLYREAMDNVVLSARVPSVGGGIAGASLGLMIRESLDPRSRHAFAMLTSVPGGLAFAFGSRSRRAALEEVRVVTGLGRPLPQFPDLWLGIERSGDTLLGWVSGDGSEWSEIGQLTLDPPLAARTLVGIAVTSQCGASPGCPFPLEASFCDVRIEGGEIESRPAFRRGDVDASGRVNLTDAVIAYNHLFRGGPPGPCADATDTNDDGQIDLTDAVHLLGYLFRGGPPPAVPGLACGPDGDDRDTLAPCGETSCGR